MVQVCMPNDPRAKAYGNIFEHRVVAENAIGRLLTAGEMVHRKNGLKFGNRPEKSEVEINLIVINK
jgi:hypothetical protein